MAASWPDRLIATFDSLPGPNWVAWLGLTAGAALVNQSTRWVSGDVPVGTFSPSLLLEVSFAPIFLGAMQALNGTALTSLRALRPVLDADDRVFQDLGRELVRTPSSWAVVALVLGTVVGIASVLTAPESYGLAPDTAGAVWIVAGLFSVAAVVSAFAFIAHAVQQLRVVSRVHRDLVRVDLFRLDPLYAFASLTSWTGIVLIAVTAYGVVTLGVLTGSLVVLSPVDLATLAIVLSVAVGCFVIPLRGLHERIQAEKDRRRAEANQTLDRVLSEVRDRVAAGEFAEFGPLNDAVAAATSGLDTINRAPTWPWRPETLRGFLSAVALPIVIWLITALLGRIVST